MLKNYTTRDGLPDGRVAPIIQDREGYIWFGTQAGLTRYDGKEFVTFSGPKEIPGIFSRSICQDHSGAIWFAYSGFNRGGLERTWKGKADAFDLTGNANDVQVRAVKEDREQAMWVATTEGLKRIRFSDSTRTTFVTDSFPAINAQAFLVDHKGRMWIAGDGVYTFSSGAFHERFAPSKTPHGFTVRSYALYESADGAIWAGGYEGAVRFTDSTMQVFSTKDGLPDRGVWSFCEDRNGNFWIGTMDGLYHAGQRGGKYSFNKEASFGDAVVYSMCLDREGNVWFASAPGVRRLLATNFFLDFPGSDMLAVPGVGPIVQSADGSMYFGSRSTGLYVFDGKRVRRRPITSNTITSIFPEPSVDRVWLGVWRVGATLVTGSGVRNFTTDDGLPSNAVHAIAKSGDGRILIGTAAGIAAVDSAGRVEKLSLPGLENLAIFDIKPSPESGVIWLGTDKGVRLLRDRSDSTVSLAAIRQFPPLSSAIVYEILIDKRHNVWIGTDGLGVIRYDGASLVAFTRQDGMAGDRVYALAEDSLGNIWIGTSSGLSQFDGSSFRNYTSAEGFNEIGIHGLTVDREGYLWVSNFPSVSKIHPQNFAKSSHSPPIYITSVEADTMRLDPTRPFEIQPDVQAIMFHYAGLSFTEEENVRYKCMLEGYDKNWSATTSAREVRYTHLPSGAYTFKVLARNSIGLWSAAPAEASFKILPPVWERWWFIAGCAALIGVTVYGGYRYRLEKLLEIERTRSRIAMDLHDDIGSSLTRISVMTEVAQRQGAADPGSTGEYLARIGDTAREIIDSLSDIVWAVNPSYDDLQNVIRRIAEFGQETCEGRGIAFETNLSGNFEAARLSIERRRDIYVLFKEGINNVVRHSGAGCAEFMVAPTPSGALLELNDDGMGFLPATPHAGNGLKTMKERAVRSGALLRIESTPGKGTRLTLELKTV